MNKQDLIKAVHARGFGIDLARKAVDDTLDSIIKELQGGGTVKLRGLGTLSVVWKPEREGSHPQTQEPILIPGRSVVQYKPSAKLTRAINAGD